MELIYILLISIVAAALSLLPVGRRFAPAVTLLGTLAVFLLSLRTALATARGGELIAVRDWLSCDSFSALILLLVAFVGLTAAIFSWGYIATTVEATDDKKIRRYYNRFNLFLLKPLPNAGIGRLMSASMLNCPSVLSNAPGTISWTSASGSFTRWNTTLPA